jgi:hypothetical protein
MNKYIECNCLFNVGCLYTVLNSLDFIVQETAYFPATIQQYRGRGLPQAQTGTADLNKQAPGPECRFRTPQLAC